MPTVNPDFNRSVVRLDTSAQRSGIFTPDIDKVEFSETALRRFNDLAKSLDPAFAPINADQVAGAARRVLRAASKGHESLFIKIRMRRAEEMRALLADPSWTAEPSLHERMAGYWPGSRQQNLDLYYFSPIAEMSMCRCRSYLHGTRSTLQHGPGTSGLN